MSLMLPVKGNVWPVSNGYCPAEGPQALPYTLVWDDFEEYAWDLYEDLARSAISIVQAVYVDNSLNTSAIRIVFSTTGQVIVVPALAQGTWPVIAPNQLRVHASSVQLADMETKLIFLNVPIASAQWGPISVNIAQVVAQLVPTTGNFVDRGTAIAVGGTSQQLMAANPARKRFMIYNPVFAAGEGVPVEEILYFNFGAAAGINNGTSIELLPGGSYDSAFGPIEVGAINVNAATTGHKIVAKEM